MVSWLIVLIVCAALATNSVESTGTPEIPITISKFVNHTAVLSCGLPDDRVERKRFWVANDEELIPTPGHQWINSDGSLTIRVQPEDATIIYRCTAFNPETRDKQDYVYGISLIIEAFLDQTVENVTLDWGSIYTFPCVFGGTAPRKDIRIFNGRVVNTTRHNVTEDSVVECLVENAQGFKHDKAFIKVRPAPHRRVVQKASDLEGKESKVFTISERINRTIVLSCGLPDLGPKYDRFWMINEEEFRPVHNYRWINSNGSLTIRVQAEDANYLYICTATLPGTTERKTYVYGISPKVEASLLHSVKNVTLDWGSIYTFPCVFVGTGPRTDKMIFNNRTVTETKHNITRDSTVECRVENELNVQHDKAYIKVRPGSEAWAQKFGPPTGDYCQPYTVALNKSSSCLHFLDELAELGPQTYLVSRSRLSSAEPVEQALVQLFNAWDQLLMEKQSSVELHSDVSSLNSVQFGQKTVSFTAWRCVDWAKRLICSLTFPRCRSLNSASSSFSRPNEFYEDQPVCRSHCLAVTGLLCLARLDASWNTSALDPLNAFTSAPLDLVETGWTQLIGVPEAHNDLLPFAHVTQKTMTTASKVIQSCTYPRDLSLTGRVSDAKQKCTHLPLENVYNLQQNTPTQKISNQSGVEFARSERDCLVGNGVGYRGSATTTHCLPWAAFDAQIEQTADSTVLGNTWPGLSALSIHTFPQSLDSEASSSAVCRNPLGLASKPFCLRPTADTSGEIGNRSRQWSIVLCDNIVPCPSTNESALNQVLRVVLKKNKTTEMSEANIQRIAVCTLVVTLGCLIIIGYVIWRFRCCRLRAWNSNLRLSSVDFQDSTDHKSGLTIQDKDQLLYEPSSNCRTSDGKNEQRDLERRRKLLNRRRRLRQLHPCCQGIASCCYRFGDCLLCHTSVESMDQKMTTVPSAIPSDGARTSRLPRAKHKSSLFNAFGLCRLSRQRDKTEPVITSVPVGGPIVAVEQFPSPTTGQARGVSLKPLDTTEDEEFEANTLSMQLQKPVAYVANAEADGRSKHAISSCLHKVCVTCGSSLHVASNTCLNCRKLVTRDSDSKDPTTAVDYQQSVLNQASVSPGINIAVADSFNDTLDPGFALTQSSMQILDSASARLGAEVLPEKLFNTASMMHLLHPRLKQICYPRNRLIEYQRLTERAFGWVILAQAPNLESLVRRYRMLSLTTTERLGLTAPPEPTSSHMKDQFEPITEKFSNEKLIIVKMLNDDANLETHANFLREAEVLVELSHKNIIKLLGVCVPLRPLSMLLEYMPYGDLTTLLRHYGQSGARGPILPLHVTSTTESFNPAANGELVFHTQATEKLNDIDLRDSKEKVWTAPNSLTQLRLLEMALDACDAMVYLSDSYYVHRDVAARSFLVGNRFVLKLSDFSLCRPIKPNIDLVAKPNECLPIKWLPVESIVNGIFQIDTDVWSFGVLLWELFSFGSEPYNELSCDQVVPFLESNRRLAKPTDCPPQIYELMLQCWSRIRAERPSFQEIRSQLRILHSR